LCFEHGLNPGVIIDNSQLTGIFKCRPQGGMRRSRQTNTLVLVSDHVRDIYGARWLSNGGDDSIQNTEAL
jgi:5-methylcytosine-specific restriction protein A